MTVIFASQLATLRQDRQLSVADLAQKMFLQEATINAWESGTASPTLQQIEQVAAILEVPAEVLIFGPLEGRVHHEYQRPGHYESHIHNGWSFLAHFWWLAFPLGWFILRVISMFTN